ALIAPPGAKQLDTIELNAGGQPTEAKDARFRVYHHATAHAGRDGKFQFDGVSPGVYTVEPNLYESKLPYYTKKAASFIVKASQTATIEVPLLPAVAVRGQVVDKESRQGVEGVGLIASLISAEGYATFMRNTTSDARGRFVAYVAPGKVVISVRQPPTGYVVPHRNGNRSENAASGDVNWPAIELQRAVRLEGIVVDESGRPIPRAEVQGLLPSDPVDLVVQTADQNGKFMFSNLDPKETLALRARTATAVSDVAQVRPNDAKGPVRLALSSARAVTIRGVCVDVGGTPVRQAKIGIQSAWMLGPTGIGCSAGGCETDADGRFALRNLWPGFQYHVSVRAEGYDAFDSFSFSTQPGDNHDTGRLPLVSTGGVVEGVVVDSSGRPVGGARVFNSGDAPKVLSTMSDAAGRFRLEGFRVGKVYVFAEKHLYQSTAVRTAARSAGLKIILLRSDEPVPPWKPTREPRPVAQEQKAVRDLLETLWPLTPQQQRSWPIQSMARIDPEQALKWSAEAGGRYDAAVRRIVAERSAETDTGETIAMLADGHDRENYWTFMSLAKRHALSDPQNSLRFAEEAVLRARKLDQPDRSSALAEAGALVARLGRVDPGKKLIDEAASVAVRMATDGRQAYVRGRVAAALASFDLPRAMGLVEPVKDANERDRALATIAAAVAPQNLGKALEIINRLDKRSTLADNARLKIAYELASTRPDDALRVVETMSAFGAVKTKAEAFGWMATAVAPRNRQLAHSLIDRGMAIYEDPKEAQGFRSWSNYGGRTVFAACLVVHARQVGYPDMAGLIRRVLAMRPAGNDEWSPRENRATSIRAAKILALVDPGCALELLETVTPTDKMPEGAVDMMQDLDLLQAWVLIDFDYTASVIESQAKSAGKERQWTNYLIQSLELLNTPPADRIRPLLNNQGGFWFPEEEL
ncbi:MAG: carboxypeptidase-like regulatory domain-containing protein, partial [Thermoguttaceae bacterium]